MKHSGVFFSFFDNLDRVFVGDFPTGGYSSGQRGQTVNLLAYAYGGSNPSPPIVMN
jgi:hypothetical protein